MGHVTVSHVLTLKVVSLNTTLETFTFAGAGYRDLFAFSEDVYLDLLTKLESFDFVDSEFFERSKILGHTCFLKVTELRKCQFLFFCLAIADLDCGVSVCFAGFNLRNINRTRFHYGDGHHFALTCIKVSHAYLFS